MRKDKKERVQRFLFLADKPPIEIRYSPIGLRITHQQRRYVFTFWGFGMWDRFESLRGFFSYSSRRGSKYLNSMLVILGMMFTWDMKGQGTE